MNPDDVRWEPLSDALVLERASASFMSLLLDDELVTRARRCLDARSRVLDFGSGDGLLAVEIARTGARVDAFEPTPSQLECLRRTIQTTGQQVTPLNTADEIGGEYDLVLCVNVIDHVEQWRETLARLAGWTRPGGSLLLVVPHPLKDLGDWHRDPPGGGAESYRWYALNGYLREGQCLKNREDRHGNVVARDLPSHHRTISSYYNELCRLGFEVREMLEPAPNPKYAQSEPILYSKSSRIPYFLLFDCVRGSSISAATER